ncbi:phage tail fiber protein [Nocardioides jensenii]|uniref:phage tail fiber protein n=1 Tax=Nocardioides jensenii TaxID=1843 RepID=UPI000832772C|nr:hypothetical protein [Nocardioides jensenii]
MPIRDVAAMNASLDNDYGTTRGPNAPAEHELALFSGDPMDGGVEVSGGGYSRVTVTEADWAAAADGEKSLLETVEFPPTTDEWEDDVTHFALIAAGEVMWDCAPLADDLVITGPGTGPAITITLFHADVLEPQED